jgi:hypothetical protein
MNVQTGAEAVLFPGKEYIIRIAVAVYVTNCLQVFTPLDVVAIAIAASGTPTKVSSNMRVSDKKYKKI